MGADDVKGRVKEAVGAATDNDDLEREGKADRLADKVKGVVDDVKEKVEDVLHRDKD
jgi:uncharacterized protein YjbJ (UPF0337 family)